MPMCSRTRKPRFQPEFLPSPKIGREHRVKRFLILYLHQRSTRTARSSVRLPDSPRRSQQGVASDNRHLARTEPQNAREAEKEPDLRSGSPSWYGSQI